MFSRKRVMISGIVLLFTLILGSQTFLPSGFLYDSVRAFASVYQSGGSSTIAVTSISLDKQSLFMRVNDKIKLIATLKPSNSTRRTPNWFSSNKKVVTVAEDGTITAVGYGTTSIVAIAEAYYAECKVTVSNATVPVTGVTISKTLTIVINQTKQLVATIIPTNATNKALTWISSSSSVVSIDSKGKIIAKKLGKATITVKTMDRNKTAQCVITVVKPVLVTGVTVSTTLTLGTNDTKLLIATIKPSNATNKALTWTSSSSSVASIDINGKITAKKIGKTTITVKTKDGNKTARCVVSVVKPVLVTGVTIDKYLTLKVLATKQLIATVKPTNATNKALTWTSSSSTVASIDANGKITAKKAGKATITVKTINGNKIATCYVTVK